MDAMELSRKTCVPCRGGVPPLPPENAREMARALPAWRLTDGDTRLRRRVKLADFPAAIAFVERIADLAEEQGHHPDFAIRGGEVELTLYTHVIGGLHENDFIMAAKIERAL